MSRRVIIGTILILMFAGGAYFWFLVSQPEGGVEHVGFVRAVSTNGNYGITFDEAQMLTGKEAEDVAIGAGLCTEATRSTCAPNDFIIDNPSEATRALEFATSILITMQTLGLEQDGLREKEISKQEFERLINGEGHWRQLPYRVTTRNGLVVAVEEIYVP